MSWTRNVTTTAAVVSAIAALGVWLLPQARFGKDQPEAGSSLPQIVNNHSEHQERPREENRVSELRPEKEPHAMQPAESGTFPRAAKEVRVNPRAEDIQEFTLSDGDQRVLCSGLIGVAADFTTVSGVDLLSLRINSGEESTYHAILGTGERFKLTCNGRELYLSVTSLDYSGESVAFQVD